MYYFDENSSGFWDGYFYSRNDTYETEDDYYEDESGDMNDPSEY